MRIVWIFPSPVTGFAGIHNFVIRRKIETKYFESFIDLTRALQPRDLEFCANSPKSYS